MARTVLILAVVVVAFAAVALAQTAPVWPAQYKFTGNFQLPYFNMSEPLTVVTDATNHRQVISWYNDMDVNLYRYDTKMSYALSPAANKMVCQTIPGHGTITAVLPSLQGWLFSGYEVANDVYCSKWVLVQTHYNKTATYNAYVDNTTGAPVRVELFGYDFIFGSHPDIYVLNVDTWQPNYNNATEFAVPALCQTEDARTHDYGLGEQLLAARERLGRLGSADAQQQVSDDTMFGHFERKFAKSYADAAERTHRRNVFKKNAAFIRNYNEDETPETGVTLAMNHLADLEEAEIRARLMPHLARPADNGATGYYVPRSAPGTLPASVDWRLKGAVAPVKDQATCGSCWTFGSAGALEGVAAVATGNLVELSEQQIVDCCWGEDGGSQGCGGGFAADAFSWIMQNGGIATEQDYPYLGQNGWCQANAAASGIQVSGYLNVTSGSEADLADAVANNGPVAVAIDATAPTFYFYSEGIFYWSKCKSDLNSLDHEVLVVGYGTSPQGQDYWIVKNSWSIYWGLDGFVLMARNRNNNCGIASQATQPVVSA